MRCRWLRDDGTCALDGTRCPGECLYFEPEEYPRRKTKNPKAVER